ncbi:MAG: DUF3048 domain-containing protein [Candidatus Berkelbacteria bacterium]
MDDQTQATNTSEESREIPETVVKTKFNLKDFFSNNKKKIIIISAIIVLIIIIFVVGILVLRSNDRNKTANSKTATQSASSSVSSQPETTAGLLTGLPLTDANYANRHPLAVMIENHPDARPQAGLVKADIVYEAIVEGGITRFMAVYSSQDADKIGPVRSARQFYVDWAQGYNAYYAHVGGHITALNEIKSDNVSDLNQFAYPAAFWRDYSQNVATEHTMFASVPKLYTQASQNGYSSDNTFSVYKFKDETTETEKLNIPETQTVTIPYGSKTYEAKFVYDKVTNSYKRFLNGAPHTDRVDKSQITVKNVIVMTVNRAPLTGVDKDTWTMTTVGSGKAKIFFDGQMIDGTWTKTSKKSREIFYDQNNQEIKFDRGNFWISVVPPDMTTTVN